MEALPTTHPAQLAAIAVVAIADIVGLYVINRYKKSHPAPQLSWERRRNAFWLLIALSVSTSCILDIYFPIDVKFIMPIKSYVFAFPLGLLDLYFSDTKGVPMKVILGAGLWCSTAILRNMAVDSWFGRPVDTLFIINEFTFTTPILEMIRYVFSLLGVGLLSDLLFSPMHRATHSPLLYKQHHKSHHEYTNKLTALVLYHGHLLDDWLMPLTTTVGGFFYTFLLSQFGLMGEAFSNLTAYVMIFNTLLSHAHDIRCARLLAPLPDELNFVAYHYVHHISPSQNFGLTEPSDQVWDYLLGVKTIVKLDDLQGKQNGNKKMQ
jgi:sterol desaturase/sphingolipid hydroxylase (fatty acid hydroxylase superfamily)